MEVGCTLAFFFGTPFEESLSESELSEMHRVVAMRSDLIPKPWREVLAPFDLTGPLPRGPHKQVKPPPQAGAIEA